MDQSVRLEARFHSGGTHAQAGKDGLTLTLRGDEERAYADFNLDTALKLGEWLVGWYKARETA